MIWTWADRRVKPGSNHSLSRAASAADWSRRNDHGGGSGHLDGKMMGWTCARFGASGVARSLPDLSRLG